MYSLLAKKGQLFAILLGLGVVIAYLAFVVGGIDSAGYNLSSDLNQVRKTDVNETFDFFNVGLGLTIGLAIVAALAVVLFGLYQMLSAPKNSLKGIIGVLVIVAIFFGLYSSADPDTASSISNTIQKFDISDDISRLISSGIFTTIILACVSLGAMVLFEIYNLFK